MTDSRSFRKGPVLPDRPVAIVTGGGTGIGAACCRILAKQGFCIGIHFRSSQTAADTLLADIGGRGFLLQADLDDINQVERMIREIQVQTGRVDVLVNNAGLCINGIMSRMKLEDFDAQRSILRGVWYLTKRILRSFMLKQDVGRIINITSVVGHTGNAGQVPYTMEKAGLDAMTKSLSKELQGRNILVNSVSPGFIETGMTRNLPDDVKQNIMDQIPLGRMGKPEEVAEAVSFLARQGNYITGSIIHVNGGLFSG